jgi:hypothetical protein
MVQAKGMRERWAEERERQGEGGGFCGDGKSGKGGKECNKERGRTGKGSVDEVDSATLLAGRGSADTCTADIAVAAPDVALALLLPASVVARVRLPVPVEGDRVAVP